MLLRLPDFQRPIREEILKSVFIPYTEPAKPIEIKDPITGAVLTIPVQEPQTTPNDTKHIDAPDDFEDLMDETPSAKTKSKAKGSENYTEPVAVVQSVSFLGFIKDSAREEEWNSRYLHANMDYFECSNQKNSPNIEWVAFNACISESPFSKYGSGLECASVEDLLGYIPANGGYIRDVDDKTRYPISTVHINIPYGADNLGEVQGIPTPEQFNKLALDLMSHGQSQVMLSIAGPKALTQQYWETLARQPKQRYRHFRIAEVDVEQGYVAATSKDYDLDAFNAIQKITSGEINPKELAQWLVENVHDYISQSIVKADLYGRRNYGGEDGELMFRERIDKVRGKVSEWEDTLDQLRKLTLGDKTDARKAIVSKLNNAGTRFDRILENKTNSHRSDEKFLSVGKNVEVKEEVLDKIKEDIKECILGFEGLCESILSVKHNCKTFPWAQRVMLYQSTQLLNFSKENFVLKTKVWDKASNQKLEKFFETREVHSSLLLPGTRIYGRGKPLKILNPANFPTMPEELKLNLLELPKAEDFAPPTVSLSLRLRPKTDLWTDTLLHMDNYQVEVYNPVYGKPTGFLDAVLWRPFISRKGITATQEALAQLGYNLECGVDTHNYVERKSRQAEKCLAPNYPLTPYEAMAYFENGARVAQQTIHHPETGEVLWVEGKSYHITPSWRRQTMLVDHSVNEEDSNDEAEAEAIAAAEAADIAVLNAPTNARKIRGSERIRTLTERRIDFGYSTFIVEAENNKTYEVRETITNDTVAIEKERVAMEIERISEQIEELQAARPTTTAAQRTNKDAIAKLEKSLEEKTIEFETWAPMLEDFLAAFPPEAPPLAAEIYSDEITAASKAVFARFASAFPGENGEVTSIKDYQIKWAAIGAVKRGHLNGSSPGAGKAQPLDCKVMTTRGKIRMGDITLDDQVYTPDGKKADVLGIFPQGKIPVYRVTLEDGRTTEACGDHLWKVYSKRWLSIDNKQKFTIPPQHVGHRVIDTNAVIRLLNETDEKIYLPLLEEVAFPPAELPIEPYLLGAILGDGGISGSAISFTNCDQDVIDEMRKLLLPNYLLKKNEGDKYGYYLSHKDGIWQANQKKGAKKFPPNPYKKSLRELGLQGQSSPTKFVPEIYKTASHQQRLELIQGLMDTDGTVGQNGELAFYSTSKQLADDFMELIWSIGGSAYRSPKQTYYTHNGRKLRGKPSYVVHFRHNSPWDMVRCWRKRVRISPNYQYAGSVRNRIVSVELIGEKEAQCIMIDHPEHLYLTDDYIVTHNTLMSIMASWKMNHNYNWVICPTIAMKSWAAELDRCGLHHEMIGYKKVGDEWVPLPGAYQQMKDLQERFHKRIRTKNRLGKIEPEYYIISAEAVSLGGDGNRVYSPWCTYHRVNNVKKFDEEKEAGKLKLPDHWEEAHSEKHGRVIKIWTDRADTSKEIETYGFKAYLKSVRFSRAVKACPSCSAEAPLWTKRGFCKKCGHAHSGITKKLSGFKARTKPAMLPFQRQNTNTYTPLGVAWQGTKKSNKQYPLYKLMGKHVGCKIIDEVHNWASFDSQHGAALQQVRAKDTIVLSGTLCKTQICELEPSLCQVYEPNSGEFPYSPWGMELFKSQFETLEIESTRRHTISTGDSGRQERINRANKTRVVPEASNLTKLRALMHGVMCTVGEAEMEAVWNLKPIRESIQYVDLQPANAEIYERWERMLQEAYAECQTDIERTNMLRHARSQLTNLAYACDGPEKLEAAVEWIQERIRNKERCVVVGPSTKFYTMLSKRLRDLKIRFVGMGSTPPEKRFEILNKFRDSDCPVFLSRIRLVNVNFNQLTCCTHILFTGIDPSPAAIRQMQKRLNRIGQTRDVHCTFLITQLPQRATDTTRPLSYEERMFSLVLRRENAIRQTLQQADRQRDPHELQEMLKDRQTLNQLVEDIVKSTQVDPEVLEQIRAMEAIQAKPRTEIAEVVEVVAEEIPEEIPTPPTINPPIEAIATPTQIEEVVAKPEPVRKTRKPRGKAKPKEITGIWKPIKKNPKFLQGELFSL